MAKLYLKKKRIRAQCQCQALWTFLLCGSDADLFGWIIFEVVNDVGWFESVRFNEKVAFGDVALRVVLVAAVWITEAAWFWIDVCSWSRIWS